MQTANTINMIISGLGGQGILFMTKILAQAALGRGTDILGAETHGMAQRGGSVVSHLKIGDTQNSLVNIGSAHYLLSLDENEAYRNLAFLGHGGRLFVNADPTTFPRPEVPAYLEKNEIAYHAMPAGPLALELGTPRSANLALIGFMAAQDDAPFDADELRGTIERISPEPFKAANLKVFEAGAAWEN